MRTMNGVYIIYYIYIIYIYIYIPKGSCISFRYWKHSALCKQRVPEESAYSMPEESASHQWGN